MISYFGIRLQMILQHVSVLEVNKVQVKLCGLGNLSEKSSSSTIDVINGNQTISTFQQVSNHSSRSESRSKDIPYNQISIIF